MVTKQNNHLQSSGILENTLSKKAFSVVFRQWSVSFCSTTKERGTVLLSQDVRKFCSFQSKQYTLISKYQGGKNWPKQSKARKQVVGRGVVHRL